jgi:prenyl protein peptidase
MSMSSDGLTVPQALAASAAIPVLFVVPFYFHSVFFRAPRDNPQVILYRAATAAFASLAITLTVNASPASCHITRFRWIGLRSHPAALLRTLALSLSLYTGTITQILLSTMQVPYHSASPHLTFRNLLIAPLLEELVFRACICRVLASASLPPATIIACSPAFFGVAHAHHVLEAVLFRGEPLRHALFSQVFQMVYTSLFGVLACLLYFSTGSLACAIVLHATCNWMGLPRLNQETQERGHSRLVLTAWVPGVAWVVREVVHMARAPFLLIECLKSPP